MIRVLVAEDSVTVRELLVHVLEADAEITVVGQAKNGREAVDLAVTLRPDLVTMDIHMPLLDGLAATKEIMIAAPTPILIVSSQVTNEQIQLSLDATRAGALMVLPTPVNPYAPGFVKQCAELVAMVKALSRVKVVRHWGPRSQPAPGPRSCAPATLVTIAASTGGPAALQQILPALPRNFSAPILIVQHIATNFVQGLASWLRGSCYLHVKVAEADETLRERTIYLAPDDRHLGTTRDRRVYLSTEPPIGGFRPSANYLFQSAAESHGSRAVGVVLTGMGRDGAVGARALRGAGGTVLAQDEDTSVIFGMPGEAIRAGAVHEVLPVGSIAGRLTALVMEKQHE